MQSFGKNTVALPTSDFNNGRREEALGFININVTPEGEDKPSQTGFIALKKSDPVHAMLFTMLENGDIGEGDLGEIFTFSYRKNEKKQVTGFKRKSA